MVVDYIISGVWMEQHLGGTHISHVFLHKLVANNTYSVGEKVAESVVIEYLKKGKSIWTNEWDYKNAKWVAGAEVSYETIGGQAYLRTKRDGTVKDNLRHLLPMGTLIKV